MRYLAPLRTAQLPRGCVNTISHGGGSSKSMTSDRWSS
jgi:hypothetical protein